MLYMTTRDKNDAFTVSRVLSGDRGPDGGLFFPFRMPEFGENELTALQEKNFGQTVAEIVNLFFPCRLTLWDVEFCVGRYPAKLQDMKQKIYAAELWHNTQWSYARLEDALSSKIRENGGFSNTTSWIKIAIRIAVLFALYGEMLRSGAVSADQSFDVALATGDFSAAMSVWYARKMGLPVSAIICGCNENSAVWNLLHHGELDTDISTVHTTTEDADIALPEEIERLICGTLGADEARHYAAICERKEIYVLKPERTEALRKGFFVSVISNERLSGLIPSVYRTVDYILGPYTALAYGGLQDFRTKNRENRPALLLADRNPVCDKKLVSDSMGISSRELENKLGII